MRKFVCLSIGFAHLQCEGRVQTTQLAERSLLTPTLMTVRFVGVINTHFSEQQNETWSTLVFVRALVWLCFWHVRQCDL